jgi:lysozyme family protein
MVLAHEGGYVNDPHDPGGMTNLGVTKRAWEAFVGHPVDEATMRGLTPARVEPFYKVQYWDKVRGDALPSGVDCAVFDYAVNSGVNRAAKDLQHAVGVGADGVIGPLTMAAINAMEPSLIVARVCDLRLSFLRSLATFDRYGKGWTCRVEKVADNAHGLMKAVA